MVERKMRRSRQLLSEEELLAVINRNDCGVLALNGDDGYPYAVPMNYYYDKERGSFLFHGSKSGYRAEIIQKNPKASFCITDLDQLIPEEYTAVFRSVIVFGQITAITDEAVMYQMIDKIALACREGFDEERKAAIEREWKLLAVYELKIESMTGKEAIELVREKEKQK